MKKILITVAIVVVVALFSVGLVSVYTNSLVGPDTKVTEVTHDEVSHEAEIGHEVIEVPEPVSVVNHINKCVGCHGSDFQRQAMGQSKVVAEMSREDIITALHGYRDGTYGGKLKGLMTQVLVNLNDTEINEIVDTIGHIVERGNN